MLGGRSPGELADRRAASLLVLTLVCWIKPPWEANAYSFPCGGAGCSIVAFSFLRRKGWKSFPHSHPSTLALWPQAWSRSEQGRRMLCACLGCVASSLIDLCCSLCSYDWEYLVLDNGHVFGFSDTVSLACWLLASRPGKEPSSLDRYKIKFLIHPDFHFAPLP